MKVRKKYSYRYYFFFPLFLLLLSLFSCENQGFLPPYQDLQTGDVEASVKSGDLLVDGDEIELALKYDEASEEPPTKMEIEIIDQNGESLGIQSLSGDELKESLPPIEITDSVKGFTTLLLRLYNDQGELVSEDGIPFFKVARIPVIERIEAYPPESVSPSNSGVLIPVIRYAEGTWLRWTMGNELLANGPYSRFANGFVWKSPEEKGVYSVKLEVFPQEPPSREKGFDFPSAVSAEVQFFVQDSSEEDLSELGPQSSYLHLMHFNGSLEDVGTDERAVELIGAPRPAVNNGILGYSFNPKDGVRIPAIELSNEDESNSGPFTIQANFDVSAGDFAERHLFSLSDSNGEVRLRLSIDENDNFMLALPSSLDTEWRLDQSAAADCKEAAFSLIPQGSELLLKWYCNGRMMDTAVFSLQDVPVFSDAVLQLGGPTDELPGFQGLMDEFGIYYRDIRGVRSEDRRIFKKWAERNLGNRTVLLAEGFEAMSSDYLSVPFDSRQDVLTLQEEWQRAYVRLDFEEILSEEAEQDLAYLILRGEEEGREVLIDLDEAVLQATGFAGSIGRSQLGFICERNGGEYRVSTVGGRELYSTDTWLAQPVTLQLENQSEGSELRIHEALVTSDYSPVTQDRENFEDNQKNLALRLKP